jgi:hypothetical protein
MQLIVPSLRRGAAALLAVLACAIGGKAVAAPAWSRPALPAALGFLVMQCDQRDFCFAIACPGNKLQLVNISPGGGPFGNPDFGGERPRRHADRGPASIFAVVHLGRQHP